MKISFTIIATMLLCLTLHAQAQTSAPSPAAAGTTPDLAVGDLQLVFREGVDSAKLDAVVAETRKRSSEMRAQGLKEALAMDPAKPEAGKLTTWIIAALYQGDQVKAANASIRLQLKPKDKGAAKAVSANVSEMQRLNSIEGGYGVRLLTLFGHDGKYPGRLEPDVEAVLKEKAWQFVCDHLDPDGVFQRNQSTYLDGRKYETFPLTWGRMWGTENHDVRRKPWVYFALSALRKDPAYADKKVDNRSVEQWFGLMNNYMKQYLQDRVLTGMWIEPGGHYANINFQAMTDLYEAAPDPVVRQRAKMFLDLALIEDEQISVNGLRGGSLSRNGPLSPTTGKFKDIVFGDKPDLLLSDYQAPPVAIVLRHAKGAVKPYHIYNRVPGENAPNQAGYVRNSHLVSYAYRSQGYLMGTALRDPNLVYHATSDQQRASSVIFQSNEIIFPWPKEIPKTKDSGRSGKAFWSVQHDGTMVLQKLLDSDSVDRMEMWFTPNLKITERAGWIFAEAGSGYAAARFVDPQEASGAGKYTWREIPVHWTEKDQRSRRIASPEKDFLPIIIQAGDPAQYGSFEKFQTAVLASKITINAKVSEFEYRLAGGPVITWNYKQLANPLVLPRVDGKTPDLLPPLLFDSPFLKATWEDPKIYAGAGPFRAVYDMEKCTVTESKK